MKFSNPFRQLFYLVLILGSINAAVLWANHLMRNPHAIFLRIDPSVEITNRISNTPVKGARIKIEAALPASAKIFSDDRGSAVIGHFFPTFTATMGHNTTIRTDETGKVHRHDFGLLEIEANEGILLETPLGVSQNDQTHWIQEIDDEGITIIVLEGTVRFTPKSSFSSYPVSEGQRLFYGFNLDRPQITEFTHVPNGSHLEFKFECDDGTEKTVTLILDKKK